jgi:hypothetical protein
VATSLDEAFTEHLAKLLDSSPYVGAVLTVQHRFGFKAEVPHILIVAETPELRDRLKAAIEKLPLGNYSVVTAYTK